MNVPYIHIKPYEYHDILYNYMPSDDMPYIVYVLINTFNSNIHIGIVIPPPCDFETYIYEKIYKHSKYEWILYSYMYTCNHVLAYLIKNKIQREFRDDTHVQHIIQTFDERIEILLQQYGSMYEYHIHPYKKKYTYVLKRYIRIFYLTLQDLNRYFRKMHSIYIE